MNTIQMIGRLTADPELRQTGGGTPVTTVRLAVPRRKRNGEDQGALYVDIVSFGSQAEAIVRYLAKGRRVAVTGRLEYREWKDAEGSPHSKHEVIADSVQFMDPPKSNGAETDYGPDEEPF